jgi:hypothetical protein
MDADVTLIEKWAHHIRFCNQINLTIILVKCVICTKKLIPKNNYLAIINFLKKNPHQHCYEIGW